MSIKILIQLQNEYLQAIEDNKHKSELGYVKLEMI
jgi:hypothetical protein